MDTLQFLPASLAELVDNLNCTIWNTSWFNYIYNILQPEEFDDEVLARYSQWKSAMNRRRKEIAKQKEKER